MQSYYEHKATHDKWVISSFQSSGAQKQNLPVEESCHKEVQNICWRKQNQAQILKTTTCRCQKTEKWPHIDRETYDIKRDMTIKDPETTRLCNEMTRGGHKITTAPQDGQMELRNNHKGPQNDQNESGNDQTVPQINQRGWWNVQKVPQNDHKCHETNTSWYKNDHTVLQNNQKGPNGATSRK